MHIKHYYQHKIQGKKKFMNKFKDGRIKLLECFTFSYSSYKRYIDTLAMNIYSDKDCTASIY